MKKIFCLVVIMLFMTACHNSTNYSILQQVDSLMSEHPDSSYNLVQTINPNDLSKADNAYYSLLFTTAQYKKYIPIPNDSIIDIAVQYYTDHFDQDKLTRALMYKGGVLADLNFNKQALESYKDAEKIADTTDCLTYGLLNFRLGELYQKSFIKNNEHINRYKIALKYFKKTNRHKSEIQTLLSIGQLYVTRNKDSAQIYLNKAINLATLAGDRQLINESRMMYVMCYNYHNIFLNKAKNAALSIYYAKDSIIIGNELYSELVNLYVKLGKIDSALYFYKQYPQSQTAIDTMRRHMMLETIAKFKNDYKAAYNNQKRANKIADSLVKAGKSEEYYAIDKEFDNQVILIQKEKLEYENNLQKFIIIISILGLFTLTTLWYLYSTRKKRILTEKEQFIDSLQSNLQYALDENIKQFDSDKANENKLKSILEKRIEIVKSLLNIKHQYGSMPDVFFNKFNEILSINQKSHEDCEDIIIMANSLYLDVIKHIEEEHPSITFKQKLLLSLVCLKFSPVEMLVFLNLNNLGSIYNLRSLLLKKLNTQSLEDYIAEQILLIKP